MNITFSKFLGFDSKNFSIIQRVSKKNSASGNTLFGLINVQYFLQFLHDLQGYYISFKMPFVSSDLLLSILRYNYLINH